MPTYEEIEAAAAAFRAKHKLDNIPIDIEHVVEVSLGMDIVPMNRLELDQNVVGFLSRDFSRIYVDEHVLTVNEKRYRFTLAHEIGHYILHQDIYGKYKFASAADYQKVIQAMSDEEVARWEGDANNFAGCLLMPLPEFEVEFQKKLELARRHGVVAGQGFGAYAAIPISKTFNVSEAAVEIRLARLHLTD